MDESSNQNKTPEKKLLPFWPHYVLSEFIAWYILFGVLIALAAFFPAGLEGKADPFNTPAGVKPEWYFLAIYQFLKVAAVFKPLGTDAPKLIGIFLPVLALIALFFLPFIERGPKRTALKRPIMLIVLFVVLAVFIGMTVLGQFGPE